MDKPKIDLTLAIPTLVVFLCVAALIVIFPEKSAENIGIMLAFLTDKTGWLFEIAGFCFLAICLWLAFGRYRNVKLGGADDKPQFSTFTWIAMLFCTGIGTTLFFWAIVEPLQYFQGPPAGVLPGVLPGSTAAKEFCMTYGIFHWGFTAWAFYIIPTIPIAYAVYVRKMPIFRFSVACRGILGKHADGFVGKIIDILVLFGIFGATLASIGTGVPLISEMCQSLFGFSDTLLLKSAILVIWVMLFGTSVYLGLEKGIANLSRINIFVSYGLLAIVFLAGPTLYILNLVTDSLGILANNFLRMSMWTDAIAQGGFPQGWTAFYFAWWLAFGPVMGLFVAKISKGRTIRQVVLGELIFGTLGCWLYFFVFGGYGLSLQFQNILDLSTILTNSGGNAAIVALINTLPLPEIVMVLAIINAFIFSGTSYDSAAYTLAFSSLKVSDKMVEPTRLWRITWAVALGVGAMSLMFIGGLSSLQTVCVTVGLPLIPVSFIMIMSFYKWVKEDFGQETESPVLVLESDPEKQNVGGVA